MLWLVSAFVLSCGHQLSVACFYTDRSQVDDMSPLFPICMARYHAMLRETHHLKHEGRLLYTLFLKDAGLSVHHALHLILSEFRKGSTLARALLREDLVSYRVVLMGQNGCLGESWDSHARDGNCQETLSILDTAPLRPGGEPNQSRSVLV